MHDGLAIIGTRRDIEEGDFVRTFLVVAPCDFDRITGITDVDELHALHDATVVDIQAGNNAFGQAHYRFISVYCICVRSV
jgi:hypothetical protein